MRLIRRLDAFADRWGGGLSGPLPRQTAIVMVMLFAAIGAIPLGAAVWNVRHDKQVAAALERGGATTDGRIVDVRYSGKLRTITGHGAKVAFRTAAGEDVVTWVTVDDPPPQGSASRVRYLVREPSVARLVDDPVPRRGVAPLFAGLAFLVSMAGAAAVWVYRDQAHRESLAGSTRSG